MPQTLAELIEAGDFKHTDSLFDARWSNRWTLRMGDRVRGDFVLIDMKGWSVYSELDVLDRMAASMGSSRTERMSFATAYELVAYASSRQNGWNGKDEILALGSKFDGKCAPMLDFVPGGGRVLELAAPTPSKLWRNHRFVLCVKA